MDKQRQAFETRINAQLEDHLKALEKLRDRQKQQLQTQLQSSRYSEAHKASMKASREQRIDEIFDDYIQWVEDTMTTEPDAYLQVISVLQAGDRYGHH